MQKAYSAIKEIIMPTEEQREITVDSNVLASLYDNALSQRESIANLQSDIYNLRNRLYAKEIELHDAMRYLSATAVYFAPENINKWAQCRNARDFYNIILEKLFMDASEVNDLDAVSDNIVICTLFRSIIESIANINTSPDNFRRNVAWVLDDIKATIAEMENILAQEA